MKKDASIWIALALLVLGIALMDRAFALWRNDGRNFRMADGQYWRPEKEPKGRSISQNHSLLATMGFLGLGMFGSSIALLGRDPESPSPTTNANDRRPMTDDHT